MRRTTTFRLGILGAALATLLFGGGTAGALGAAPAKQASVGVEACEPGSSGARTGDGAAGKEPALYPDNEAKAYGSLPDSPYLGNGTVTVPTVFHSISDHPLTATERARFQKMISDQMRVLNASFAGRTDAGQDADAADTPFRFQLTKINWVVDATWYEVVPGKTERAMKRALHEGDSRTLNVYSANIGDNLLGWAYFPKGIKDGREFIDGVVILDESMPGGSAGTNAKYGLGDTLVHETGHWLMLEHTFAHGCSAAGDYVADTPKEAYPQFDCPEGADTCRAPGLDPIHNFMDYTQDSCMYMFTRGQAERMSDAWVAFRA